MCVQGFVWNPERKRLLGKSKPTNTVMHLRISNNAGISSVAEELCPVELVTKCSCRWKSLAALRLRY